MKIYERLIPSRVKSARDSDIRNVSVSADSPKNTALSFSVSSFPERVSAPPLPENREVRDIPVL